MLNKKSFFLLLVFLIVIEFMSGCSINSRIESVTYKDIENNLIKVYTCYIFELDKIEIFNSQTNESLQCLNNVKEYFFKTQYSYGKKTILRYEETSIINNIEWKDGKLYYSLFDSYIYFKITLGKKIKTYDVKISSGEGLSTISYVNSNDFVSRIKEFYYKKIAVPTININVKYN